MNRFLPRAIALLTVACVSLSASATNPNAAKTFVDTVATQVLAIVKTEGLSATAKQTKIEALFSDKVDLNFIAKFVLGKHARTTTPKQQQDYLNAYKPFILKNYAGKLTKYSGQTYTLKNARSDDDASVVTMEINDPNGQNVIVDYRLRGDAGNFKIVDITVEGVSLLTTQRSEFNGIIENKGIDGLIEALKSQVAAKS
jgi:phospholipid transport system substrate-binding protein